LEKNLHTARWATRLSRFRRLSKKGYIALGIKTKSAVLVKKKVFIIKVFISDQVEFLLQENMTSVV